jgi:HEAT repeats
VTPGLEKTRQTLARTRNRAVLQLLAAGLRSDSAAIRAAAIRAAIQRTDLESHTQVIRLLATFGDAERAVLTEVHGAMPHHAAPAIKAALLGGDTKLCLNACQMILACQDFDAFPALLKAAENPQHRQASLIATTILQLTDQWRERLSEWSAGTTRRGPDPSFVRHRMLAALERSLEHNGQHLQSETLEAFLHLASSDERLLRRILCDSTHPCHARLVTILASSGRPAVFERLVELLSDAEAPAAAIQVIAGRTDRPFVAYLLRQLRHPISLRVLHNMKRLSNVAWLQPDHEMLLDLDGRAQAIAVELAAASDMEEEALFDLIVLISREGLSEGRRAACQALAKFKSPSADMLVLAVLDDPDAAVQAAALRQLRPRRLPDALRVLVDLLDSPSAEVRDAARSSLAEFNFVRYRAMFELLDDHAVKTTGLLVRKVDAAAVEGLLDELTSPSISSRLRGIEMALAMQATQDVFGQLVELAKQENLAVRAAALEALAGCRGPQVREVLQLGSEDANQTIAETARRSLEQYEQQMAGNRGEHTAPIGDAS